MQLYLCKVTYSGRRIHQTTSRTAVIVAYLMLVTSNSNKDGVKFLLTVFVDPPCSLVAIAVSEHVKTESVTYVFSLYPRSDCCHFIPPNHSIGLYLVHFT